MLANGGQNRSHNKATNLPCSALVGRIIMRGLTETTLSTAEQSSEDWLRDLHPTCGTNSLGAPHLLQLGKVDRFEGSALKVGDPYPHEATISVKLAASM